MGKYLFVYYGSKLMVTPEEQKKSMNEWLAWFAKLGKAVVDMGAPAMPGMMVSKSGNKPIGDNPVTGYSIITADNLGPAACMAAGCPNIPEDGQVAVYELLTME